MLQMICHVITPYSSILEPLKISVISLRNIVVISSLSLSGSSETSRIEQIVL